jgi:hypothetical protein
MDGAFYAALGGRMGETADSGDEIPSFGKDSADIEAATAVARNISHWYPWTAYPRLSAVEATRARLEDRVNKSLSQFESKVTQIPLVAAIHGSGDIAGFAQTSQMINAINGMTKSFLLVNSLQQKMQGLGAIIERKYALAFGVISLYIGIIFAVAFGAVPIWQEAHKHEGSMAVVPPAVPRVFLLQGPASVRLAMLPVLFQANAKGEVDGWRAGITLSHYDEEFLKSLVRGLRGCVRKSTSPVIALEVVGFASSAEFRAQGTRVADSSRLNLEAANRRAREVSFFLERIRDERGSEKWMEIETHLWPTFDEMAKNRPYDDGSDSAPQQREQELLNRSAQIRLVSASACEQLVVKEP